MSPRRFNAYTDDAPLTVVGALRGNARLLILFGVFLAGATFAALGVLAPSSPVAASLPLMTKAAVSVLIGLSALVLGAVSVGLGTMLAGKSKRTTRPARTEDRREPLVTDGDDPLLKDMPEAQTALPSEEGGVSVQPSVLSEATSESAPPPYIYDEIGAVAARIGGTRSVGGGRRTLVTGEAEDIVSFNEALELARALSESGAQVILVDWSPSGDGLARVTGLKMKPGLNDLLGSAVHFDAIIQRLPGTQAHAIASGEPLAAGTSGIEADFLNLALDVLDEAYDHIIVVGRYSEARSLFELIEGRFDTGITVGARGEDLSVEELPGMFLGFEVSDIDVLRYQPRSDAPSPMAHRIAWATRAREAARVASSGAVSG